MTARLPTQQAVLAALLMIEVAVFAVLGPNFFTAENAFEVARLVVEIGLLALALTPVIVAGGIDLSVGSLMGLAAVVLGIVWRDWGWPVWLAAAAAVAVGALAGTLNAVVITRFGIPPLIVTLGSLSLFRGLAEGLTGGVENYTGFPPSFLFLGQGYMLGGTPAQLPLFVIAALSFWVLVHRSIVGRGLSAIGYSTDGARHAGLPVEGWTALTYILSGAAAGLAAVIYVAHVGQAKADAGTNYELAAITAVVLGGTSIFGGRGSVGGTVLGLFAIAVLQNGLRMALLPAELAGIMTGILLLTTISIDWLVTRPAPPARTEGDFVVKNSQVAVLAAVILAAAGIVAGSNWYLVKSLNPEKTRGQSASGYPDAAPLAKPITVAMMPKSKGNAYFIACRQGAEAAARELGVNLIWDGPTEPDPAKQNEVVDAWITNKVDVIAVACENRDGVSTVLRKARDRGIKVLTWDSDAQPDARDFFVNQATPEGIGTTLMDTAAKVMGGRGQFAIITASLTAANMNEWQKYIEARRKEKYPDITMAALRPCDDIQKKAFDEANVIMNAHPDVKLIMAICSPAVPGAGEAVRQSGRKDVKVIGLGLPNDNKPYVHAGITEAVVLWNTMDLGYLTVRAATALHAGELRPGATRLRAGRLGEIEVRADNVLLGKPLVFTKDNIDRFNF
jgi:ribose/xylose/arabinose/galactoside ABC-type transport system permease subunit/ABC-type sugar transport system substrate-binding protein